MNENYGIILWIVIGGLAGWIASKLMGTDRRQGLVANIVIGIVGAIVGGYVSRQFLGGAGSDNGLISSFVVALLGACGVIFLWKLVSGRKA